MASYHGEEQSNKNQLPTHGGGSFAHPNFSKKKKNFYIEVAYCLIIVFGDDNIMHHFNMNVLIKEMRETVLDSIYHDGIRWYVLCYMSRSYIMILSQN